MELFLPIFSTMKKVLIAGSSGMIGNIILKLCLASQDIEKVTIINRKKSGIQHKKLIEIIHSDFLNLTSIANAFANIDITYYCIGVYTGQVPKEEFNKITIDYTKAFGNMLKVQSPNAVFCFLSGQGADSSEKSKVLFAKAKGIAENYLFDLNFPQTYTFRPGYIYPVEKRKEPNTLYKIFRAVYKPLAFIYPNIGLTSTQLANKMFTVGLYGFDKKVLENKDLRK
jgi:nucleoside-diphosphate-sugar epimerase